MRYRCRSIFGSINRCEEAIVVDLESIHISTAVMALKSRHHLSNTCIDDILALLKALGIDAPSSYGSICTQLRVRSNAHLSRSAFTICPHCGQSSTKTCRCTASAAKYSPVPSSNIPLLYNYDILPQLSAILATSPDLVLANTPDLNEKNMKDITNGRMCKQLLGNEFEAFLTLTMNVDGVQPKKV